jgi:hypothetical protein
MQTRPSKRYWNRTHRTEVISLFTTWVRERRPFGRRPPILLAARLASDAIDLADRWGEDEHGDLASAPWWELRTQAFLLAMLADFDSVVHAVATTISARDPIPGQLRKVCERAAIRALVGGAADLRAELYRSSLGHACHILDERVHSLRLIGATSRKGESANTDTR